MGPSDDAHLTCNRPDRPETAAATAATHLQEPLQRSGYDKTVGDDDHTIADRFAAFNRVR